jgi:hypothetical protein
MEEVIQISNTTGKPNTFQKKGGASKGKRKFFAVEKFLTNRHPVL